MARERISTIRNVIKFVDKVNAEKFTVCDEFGHVFNRVDQRGDRFDLYFDNRQIVTNLPATAQVFILEDGLGSEFRIDLECASVKSNVQRCIEQRDTINRNRGTVYDGLVIVDHIIGHVDYNGVTTYTLHEDDKPYKKNVLGDYPLEVVDDQLGTNFFYLEFKIAYLKA